MKSAFEDIRTGDKTSYSRIVTDHDIEMFAAVTGDCNPIHLDSEFARGTIFKGRIAHGMLTAGLVSAAVSKFPGVIIYLSQSLSFLKLVRPGDRIEATAEVIEKADERSELRLKTVCVNQAGDVILTGEARIRVFEHDSRPSLDQSKPKR
jgi:3-hydroxybutyryl-CoA dehydratase